MIKAYLGSQLTLRNVQPNSFLRQLLNKLLVVVMVDGFAHVFSILGGLETLQHHAMIVTLFENGIFQ
ncbi:MAG TPA: hypothetical protein VFW94_03405 [Candidatus Acidoferrales bacterium]|nr:hypothetical protein [Candidatus Acidoferrales bacterium]